MNSVYALTSEDWTPVLQKFGQNQNVLPFLLEGLYKDPKVLARHVSENFLTSLRKEYIFHRPEISRVSEARDGTVKFLVRFQDLAEVETVLIPFHKRFTVCLSTQVGCAMNCSFCFTGTQGLKRHLSADEIAGQYAAALAWLREKNSEALAPSIVFMGQGEPLHNADEVKKAIEILNDHKIFGVGHRQMTLSTVGFLPALEKLKSFPRINIALSLHSPFQDQRSELIPVNERYPLSEVMEALGKLPLLKRQFITFEYLLIKNFNMSDAHVKGLSELLRDKKAILNLIPFNPFPGSRWERPDVKEIEEFKEKLVREKLRVMVRTTKGDEILAACGQLKIEKQSRAYGK